MRIIHWNWGEFRFTPTFSDEEIKLCHGNLENLLLQFVLDDRRQKMLDPVSMLLVNHRETRNLAVFPPFHPWICSRLRPNRGRSNLAKHAQCWVEIVLKQAIHRLVQDGLLKENRIQNVLPNIEYTARKTWFDHVQCWICSCRGWNLRLWILQPITGEGLQEWGKQLDGNVAMAKTMK